MIVATATLQPLQDACGRGAIVFDAVRVPQAGATLFDPSQPQARPVAVEAGGRGAAWFVSGSYGEGVLRHYRRGGLAARLSKDRYVWTGAARTRSFREFELLGSLRAQGLPVPAPLAAQYLRQGPTYRAAIVIERIAAAQSLAQRRAQLDLAGWSQVGGTLARFHRAGVWHADLNAHNVLIDAAGQVWLIDFDRGRLRTPAWRWQQGNLARLQRSLAKLAGGALDAIGRRGWQALRAAYAAGSRT